VASTLPADPHILQKKSSQKQQIAMIQKFPIFLKSPKNIQKVLDFLIVIQTY
jgi:hypothetical protein